MVRRCPNGGLQTQRGCSGIARAGGSTSGSAQVKAGQSGPTLGGGRDQKPSRRPLRRPGNPRMAGSTVLYGSVRRSPAGDGSGFVCPASSLSAATSQSSVRPGVGGGGPRPVPPSASDRREDAVEAFEDAGSASRGTRNGVVHRNLEEPSRDAAWPASAKMRRDRPPSVYSSARCESLAKTCRPPAGPREGYAGGGARS